MTLSHDLPPPQPSREASIQMKTVGRPKSRDCQSCRFSWCNHHRRDSTMGWSRRTLSCLERASVRGPSNIYPIPKRGHTWTAKARCPRNLSHCSKSVNPCAAKLRANHSIAKIFSSGSLILAALPFQTDPSQVISWVGVSTDFLSVKKEALLLQNMSEYAAIPQTYLLEGEQTLKL